MEDPVKAKLLRAKELAEELASIVDELNWDSMHGVYRLRDTIDEALDGYQEPAA